MIHAARPALVHATRSLFRVRASAASSSSSAAARLAAPRHVASFVGRRRQPLVVVARRSNVAMASAATAAPADVASFIETFNADYAKAHKAYEDNFWCDARDARRPRDAPRPRSRRVFLRSSVLQVVALVLDRSAIDAR
jgi:hypothetical protein